MTRSNVLTRSKKAKVQVLIQEGRLSQARELCTGIVRADRLDTEAWVTLAVINRRLALYQESESCARQALSLRSDMAAARTALGAARQCQGHMQEAISCYRQATELDPNLAEAHYLLGNALRELGLLDEAVASYRLACDLQPDFLAAISNLGTALMIQGQTKEALIYLQRALELAPHSPQVLCSVGALLESDTRLEEARSMFQKALATDPNFVDAIAFLASLEEKMSHLDAAKALLTRGLALYPDNIRLIMTAGKIARTEGRHEDAIGLLERAIVQRPPPTLAGELHLLLGMLYDRVGDVDRAFHCFTEGNRFIADVLVPDTCDRHGYRRYMDQLTAFFTDTLANAWDQSEDDLKGHSPVFLLGFPRSGTTLLDQLLDSHPRMQTLSERPTVEAMQEAFLALARDRPQALTNLRPDEIAMLRKVYFDKAANFVRLDRNRLLIDKHPLNTIVAHLMWRVFPHAKFILAVRHPCDVCLSCFMQNFMLNPAMTTFQSLQETTELYTHVMGMWRRYVEVLPINYHQVRYEDLVTDFEGEARRLIAFLGVEWDDAVLSYAEHAKRRVVATVSYHQVTQPIYQHAKYRWKRYAKHLAPYLPALAPYIDYFGYAEPEASRDAAPRDA